MWDWRFLILLFIISGSGYLIADLIQKKGEQRIRKYLFILGLVINVGTLVVFKYFNFFINGFIHFMAVFGFIVNLHTINIILPVGISFYIFLSISYIVDVYQHKLLPERNFVNLLLTLGFFPIILAGPIQRPISLLPQIKNKRNFDYGRATDGLRQILWGVFMKIVIADNCAVPVNTIFSDIGAYSGSTLVLGIFLFTVQIYTDFAGYSNIAIGLGKLLGFNLMQNFAYPYFAKNIREFWTRWNISLTSWFRDYVFLPVAYSVSGSIKSERFYFFKTEIVIYIIGVSVTWLLTGLWHGANYTFITWGVIQGFFLVLNHINSKPRKRFLKRMNIRNDNFLLASVGRILTVIIIMFSWIFFRAETVKQALVYISGIFSSSLFKMPDDFGINYLFILILMLFFIEWKGRKMEFGLSGLGLKWPRIARWVMYTCLVAAILWFSGEEKQFIYFNF